MLRSQQSLEQQKHQEENNPHHEVSSPIADLGQNTVEWVGSQNKASKDSEGGSLNKDWDLNQDPLGNVPVPYLELQSLVFNESSPIKEPQVYNQTKYLF